jgi:membrane fusion protein (multidrug efflux system)
MIWVEKKRATESICLLLIPVISACTISMLTIFIPCWAKAQPLEKREGPPPAAVGVTTVLEEDVISLITLVGTAEPSLETVVASEQAGVVSRMFIEEGDQVEKNQELCALDDTQLQLKIDAARAELAEARVLLSQAEGDWERQKKLFEIQSVSEKAYDDARFKLDAAQKRVTRLRANLRSLEDQLSKMTIKAPVSGYIVRRHCLVGQWLGEGNAAVTLVVPDPIFFMVPVPERYVSSVKIGDPVQVMFDALPDRSFNGEIDAVIPKADASARTFPVRIKIPNPDGTIKPGMLGRSNLPIGDHRRAILVPKDALVLSGAEKVVYLAVNQKARLVPVETGTAHGPFIEVKGDLKAGQKVVVRGNERLRPGQPVQIISETPPPTIKDP